MELVGQHVVRGANSVCLISDRHKGIVRAVDDLPYFKPPHGVHRFCLRHICSNFNSKFKDVHLKDLAWEAGTQHQICKFDSVMEAIKNKNILAHRYLNGISKEKCSLAYDSAWRRGVMTTNMSECLNSVLKGARRLPITAIVQLTLMRCVHYFIERVTKGHRMVQNCGQIMHVESMRSGRENPTSIELRSMMFEPKLLRLRPEEDQVVDIMCRWLNYQQVIVHVANGRFLASHVHMLFALLNGTR